MRLTEMQQKEIIDFEHGGVLGVPGRLDACIDPESGAVHCLLLPNGKKLIGKRRNDMMEIPWASLKTVGEDAVIIHWSPS
ncbi:YlmC/YmxH family sporulation protein [Salsuginibacillus halophilus]|uniref:YlmC/YmxH family sporulation protein n=1 Tax=Salsuginibacillus halophilus TaxID=517424 RepID=A0A2P8HYE5_9BACI|nr:YlmC/YmxH family sporulation protein [Salsuginibacillus halophilus]PSL51240.1 YlmC/YmxH family sporulation protein [Salsuginibacillus halophilus]